jgi:hypothetical protein
VLNFAQLDVHFITRQTLLDVIVMCQARIFLVKLYREEHSTYRIFGDRFSSRFSEYVFQYARMAETNSPLFSVLGFKRHLRHFHLMMDMAVTSGLKMPHSKRGVPNDVSRVDIVKHATPPGWHLTDAEICGILDGMVQGVADPSGAGDCTLWWVGVLQCPEITGNDLRRAQEFFSAPVKHFKKGDLWGDGVDFAGSDHNSEGTDDPVSYRCCFCRFRCRSPAVAAALLPLMKLMPQLMLLLSCLRCGSCRCHCC